jgi:hypothetical protein
LSFYCSTIYCSTLSRSASAIGQNLTVRNKLGCLGGLGVTKLSPGCQAASSLQIQRTKLIQLVNTAMATESTLPAKMIQPIFLLFIADPPS